jgi:hypothetical protein
MEPRGGDRARLSRNRIFRTAQLQLNNIDRTAILDGVIVDGWRVGGLVHVELQVKTTV